MTFKQCKFKDIENDTVLGGLINEDENYIICGCCGCILDLNDPENTGYYEVLEIYEYWVNISEEIIGE